MLNLCCRNFKIYFKTFMPCVQLFYTSLFIKGVEKTIASHSQYERLSFGQKNNNSWSCNDIKKTILNMNLLTSQEQFSPCEKFCLTRRFYILLHIKTGSSFFKKKNKPS